MWFGNDSDSTVTHHGCSRPLNKLPGHAQYHENVITNLESNDTKKRIHRKIDITNQI